MAGKAKATVEVESNEKKVTKNADCAVNRFMFICTLLREMLLHF